MAKRKEKYGLYLVMISEASLMIVAWACTSKNPLNAAGNTIQEV